MCALNKNFNKGKVLHDTIEIKALAHVYKLKPSSLMQAIIFLVKENLYNNFYNLGITVASLVCHLKQPSKCLIKWFTFVTKQCFFFLGTLYSNAYGDQYILRSTNWD